MSKKKSVIEWRPVVGWEGVYEISSTGDVRRVGIFQTYREDHRIKPTMIYGGRRWFTLFHKERRKYYSANKLFVDAFPELEPIEPPKVVRRNAARLKQE